MSFGVVCGIVGDKSGRRCTPHGAVFVRAAGEAGFRRCPLEPEPGGLLSRRPRRLRRIGGSTLRCARGTAAGGARRCRRREQRRRSTSGRSRDGRRSTWERTLRREPRRLRRSSRSFIWGKGSQCGRARQRSGAVEDRAVGIRRRPRWLNRRARPGEPPAGRGSSRAPGGRRSCPCPCRRGRRSRGRRRRDDLRPRSLGEAAASLVLARRGADFRRPARRAGRRHGPRRPVRPARARLSVRDVAGLREAVARL